MDAKTIYYSSHSKLSFMDEQAQDRLCETSVLVIGAGGLGCPCLLALAGAGIGTIGIADFDTVSISNIHRQPLYTVEDAGKMKTTVAAERLRRYNPFIEVHEHPVAVNESNCIGLLKGYDVIVDGTDNFYSRYLLNDASAWLKKPLVYGAIHQGEGQVTVFNHHGSPTLRCLFPNDEHTMIASCSDIGAYNICTAVIGNLLASEVIKVILQLPGILAGTLLQYDIVDSSMHKIRYLKSEQGYNDSIARFVTHGQREISPGELLQKKKNSHIILIDVRTPDEHDQQNIGGTNIPLTALLHQNSFPFSTGDEIVLYCETGSRSLDAVLFLRQKGFKKSFSLSGGLRQFPGLEMNSHNSTF